MKKWYKNIKNLRLSSNMTQKSLADQLHVSNTLISKWEKGEREPSIEHIQEIAKIFHVTVDSIMNKDKTVNTDLDMKRNIELFRFTDAKNITLFVVKILIVALFFIAALISKEGNELFGLILFGIGIIIVGIEIYYFITPKQFIDTYSVSLNKQIVFEYKGTIQRKKQYSRIILILVFAFFNLFVVSLVNFIIARQTNNNLDQTILIVLVVLLFMNYVAMLLLESISTTYKNKIRYNDFQYKKTIFVYRFLIILNSIWFFIVYAGLLFYGVNYFLTNDLWVLIVLPPFIYIFSNLLFIERMYEFEGYELKL